MFTKFNDSFRRETVTAQIYYSSELPLILSNLIFFNFLAG